MDRLEQDLRDTLSDGRLSLPARTDSLTVIQAGVRRRRRNRAVATASAAVVLLAGGITAASLATRVGAGQERVFGPAIGVTPTPATKPSLPAPAHDEVRWAADSYDYHQPPAFPGSAADLSVPWCRAAALALSQAFQGAGGNWVGSVTVTNTSATACAIQGQPAVRIESADARTLVASAPEPFYVDEWVRLAPGGTAAAQVQWMQQYCGIATPARIAIELPHDGGALSTSFSGRPVCDSPVPTTSHLDVGGFLSRPGTPFTPEAGLRARIDKASPSVAPGAVLAYQLQLQSMDAPQVSLDPCLPYRERLVDHATGRVLIEEDHLLNCGDTGDITDPQSNHDTFFDLQLVVPANAPSGDYDLLWQSVLKPVNAVGEQLVRVTPRVPACADGQVSASAGRGGAGLGSYYQAIVFRNVSTTTCSLFGFPGVVLADRYGQPVKTDQQRDPTTPAHLVVLAPGEAASATISGADSGPNGGATPCRPSAGVLVIAPGQHLQTLVRGRGMRCYDRVDVYPVAPGTRGSMGS